MEINATTQDFIRWVGEILQIVPREADGKYIFDFPINGGIKSTEVVLSELDHNLKNLLLKEEIEETIIYEKRSLEMLVREGSSSPFDLTYRMFRTPDAKIVKNDEENGITYILSRPSDEYLLYLIYRISKFNEFRSVWNPNFFRRSLRFQENESVVINIFETLRYASPRLMTLRLESIKDKKANEFTKFSNAFLFQISYNLDLSLVSQRYLDEFLRAGRIAKFRRSRIDDIEPPRRFYVPELLYHYQMAVASESPQLEYLSYYHIIEYFFERVFNEELITKVKNKITLPDFSYKSESDIKNLIEEIKKSFKLRQGDTTFGEEEALRLTLVRYVDIAVLIKKLKEYDEPLIAYYKTNTVSFSRGNNVDLENSDILSIYKAISGRIYKTRNSIVHSKEGDKSRYIPFEHDRLLIKEVPLLRFIAELIIMNTSSIIE
jgi:hypothetical protein